MTRTLNGSIRFANVTGGSSDGYVNIELDDDESRIGFLEIKLSYEQFGKLVGSNASVDCEYTVRGAEFLGKTYEHKPGSAKMPADVYRKLTDGVKYDDRKKPLRVWLNENAKEDGWHISAYLGSRDSIIGTGWDDEPITLNFTYFRYVEKIEQSA